MNSSSLRSLGAGITAYSLWGMFPLYWRALSAVPPDLILAHRVVWSFAAVFMFVRLVGGLAPISELFSDWHKLAPLLASSLLIASNWFVYIAAVQHGHVVECSLGYFITPILTVSLGVLFLKERLSGLQLLSLALVVLGVGIRTHSYGAIPWYGLTLAFTFSLYGLLRKRFSVNSSHGLLVETTWLFPLAGAYIIWSEVVGSSPVRYLGPLELFLLLASGVVTAVPLGLFAEAARGLSLTALSIIQYLSPTIQLVLGCLVFHEQVTQTAWVAFICVWAGVVCFAADTLAKTRKGTERGKRSAL